MSQNCDTQKHNTMREFSTSDPAIERARNTQSPDVQVPLLRNVPSIISVVVGSNAPKYSQLNVASTIDVLVNVTYEV